ncbi:hypothetical protein, partial [Nocardioides sp.]|uniref:hypothetical protein n=1 Tax=Nocardioides sp. TaxID=35761 RepID=UPI002736BDCB
EITGDEGDDTIYPGDGPDHVYGEEGYDHVIATDDAARDVIMCFGVPGVDPPPKSGGLLTYVGAVDRLDHVVGCDIEVVDASAAPQRHHRPW